MLLLLFLTTLLPILTNGWEETLCKMQLNSCAASVTTVSQADSFCGPFTTTKCIFPSMNGVTNAPACCNNAWCYFYNPVTDSAMGGVQNGPLEDLCEGYAADAAAGGTVQPPPPPPQPQTTQQTPQTTQPKTTQQTPPFTTAATGGGSGGLVSPSTTEADGIAWAKAFTCEAGKPFNFLDPFNDLAGFVEYAQYANSIKFVTPNGVTMYAKQCSNPVINLNNGKDASFTTDANGIITGYSNTNNWVGSTQYVSNECYPGTGANQPPRNLDISIFHACNNHAGLHVVPENWSCQVAGETTLDVYLGFDVNLANDCAGNALPFQNTNRDCSVLAIDEFLTQCSTEFPAQVTAVTDLEVKLTGIELNLQGQIDTNAADILQLQTDLQSGSGNVATQIQQLQTDIDDVNGRIDLFAAKSPNSMLMDNNNESVLNLLGLNMTDIFIIMLLIANCITMCYIYCYQIKKTNGKNKEYSVPCDEESDIEQ